METSDGNNKKPHLSAKTKRRLIGLIASFAGLGMSAAAVFGAAQLYDSFFGRYERPDYGLVAGYYNYDLVRDVMPREEIDFYSDGVKLRGYYYRAEKSEGLVVVSHGIHAGADDYLPAILYFYSHGFSVFAYNYKGTYDSEGDSTVGMSESLVDLNHAIEFIQSDARFKNMPLYLFGHSWGGFATAAVLSLKSNIKAAACVAPFNDGYHLILEKGYQYAGDFGAGKVPHAFLDVYQKILFRDYTQYTGVKGINSTDIPVVIAHGENDKVISYNAQSITAQKDKITNPNVIYYTGKGLLSGHDTIWHSERSARYQQEIAALIKSKKQDKGGKLTDGELRDIYRLVDNGLYSEVNGELFDLILQTFRKAK